MGRSLVLYSLYIVRTISIPIFMDLDTNIVINPRLEIDLGNDALFNQS